MWMSGSLDALGEDQYLRIVVNAVKRALRYNDIRHNGRASRRGISLVRDHLLAMRKSVTRQMEVRRTYQWGAVQVRVVEERGQIL